MGEGGGTVVVGRCIQFYLLFENDLQLYLGRVIIVDSCWIEINFHFGR